MTDAARKHDARYGAFAADMLSALAAEEARIARYNGEVVLYGPANGTSDTMFAPTVRPAR